MKPNTAGRSGGDRVKQERQSTRCATFKAVDDLKNGNEYPMENARRLRYSAPRRFSSMDAFTMKRRRLVFLMPHGFNLNLAPHDTQPFCRREKCCYYRCSLNVSTATRKGTSDARIRRR